MKKKTKDEKALVRGHLIENIAAFSASLFIAFLLARSDAFAALITANEIAKFVTAFVAGLFFTSALTAAPATVAFALIARTNPVLPLALVGGIGAVVGDVFIFRFLREQLTADLGFLFSHAKIHRLGKALHLKTPRWLLILAGVLVIASPFPDELGLVIMGVSRIRLLMLIPLSFAFNTFGIFVAAVLAKGFV